MEKGQRDVAQKFTTANAEQPNLVPAGMALPAERAVQATGIGENQAGLEKGKNAVKVTKTVTTDSTGAENIDIKVEITE